GLRQEDFADFVETNKSNVSKWLSGQGQRQETVDYVADRLGMAPWELLRYAEDDAEELPPHVHAMARKIAELPAERQVVVTRSFLQSLSAWAPNDAMNVAVAGAR